MKSTRLITLTSTLKTTPTVLSYKPQIVKIPVAPVIELKKIEYLRQMKQKEEEKRRADQEKEKAKHLVAF